ncbi:MAG: hypothetical protein WBD31_11805 [Rubripirellula sp.]
MLTTTMLTQAASVRESTRANDHTMPSRVDLAGLIATRTGGQSA